MNIINTAEQWNTRFGDRITPLMGERGERNLLQRKFYRVNEQQFWLKLHDSRYHINRYGQKLNLYSWNKDE